MTATVTGNWVEVDLSDERELGRLFGRLRRELASPFRRIIFDPPTDRVYLLCANSYDAMVARDEAMRLCASQPPVLTSGR